MTGLEFVNDSGNLLLVTTNDSRVRLINMEDYSLMYKYKGLVNKSCQIRASFEYACYNDDGDSDHCLMMVIDVCLQHIGGLHRVRL